MIFLLLFQHLVFFENSVMILVLLQGSKGQEGHLGESGAVGERGPMGFLGPKGNRGTIGFAVKLDFKSWFIIRSLNQYFLLTIVLCLFYF